jgi:hydrogenase maturation protease
VTEEPPRPPPRVLVGGVSELYQGDLDTGRVVVERLAGEDLGPGVAVEDLHYGAVAVAQRLQELDLHALILVGARARGRRPATVERRRILLEHRSAEELQAAVGDAVTGYVGMDLVVQVAQALATLPERTVAVEVEPVTAAPRDSLSPEVAAALEEVLDAVRAEVARVLVEPS